MVAISEMGTTNTTTEAIEPMREVVVSLGNEKSTILMNIEEGVKDVITAIAKKVKYEGIDASESKFSHFPNSQTGVVMHFVVRGLETELGIRFSEPPKSLKIRGGISKWDKKVAGKKRLLTREQKNELLAKTQMSFYDDKISNGEMSIENAMYAIRDAYEQVKAFKDIGYILPPEKTKYPYFINEEQTTDVK
jgi:hypothetical protein